MVPTAMIFGLPPNLQTWQYWSPLSQLTMSNGWNLPPTPRPLSARTRSGSGFGAWAVVLASSVFFSVSVLVSVLVTVLVSVLVADLLSPPQARASARARRTGRWIFCMAGQCGQTRGDRASGRAVRRPRRLLASAAHAELASHVPGRLGARRRGVAGAGGRVGRRAGPSSAGACVGSAERRTGRARIGESPLLRDEGLARAALDAATAGGGWLRRRAAGRVATRADQRARRSRERVWASARSTGSGCGCWSTARGGSRPRRSRGRTGQAAGQRGQGGGRGGEVGGDDGAGRARC
jgi:hypothetical protein